MKQGTAREPGDLRQRADVLRAHRVLLFVAAVLTGLVASVGSQPRAEEGLPGADTTSGSSSAKPVRPRSADGDCAKVNEILTLEKDLDALKTEIARNAGTIARMQSLLDASRAPGAEPFDPNRLTAMGIAGVGAVGPGKSTPQVVKDVIASYEGLSVRNAVDALANQAMKAGYMTQALEEARARLGVKSVKDLPPDEKDKARKMGQGRASLTLEIKRNSQYQDLLRQRFAEINASRMALWRSLGPLDLERYRSGDCTKTTTSAAGGGEGAAGGSCPPVRGWSLPAGATCTTTAAGAAPHGHPEH
jgi:hypothetical protein